MSSPPPAAATAMVVAASALLKRDTDWLLDRLAAAHHKLRLPISNGSAFRHKTADAATISHARQCHTPCLHKGEMSMTGKDRESKGSGPVASANREPATLVRSACPHVAVRHEGPGSG